MTLRLLLTGASGQTGSRVLALAEAEPGVALAGRLGAELPDALPEADVVVDFSVPETTERLAQACARDGVALVTGTTGLSQAQQEAVAAAARAVPVVQAGNFSVGVTVLAALVARAGSLLGDGFDVEILETHHRRKRDAPSGTALMLGAAAAQARGTSLDEVAVHARPRQGVRARGEIGFAVRRGGGVFGEHEVAFLAEEEAVTLGHQALSRDVFARGALTAAAWTAGRASGLYSMREVLGL